MLRTRFTDLVGCSVPIQLAGMGGVGTPDLAVAVGRAGGLGMIGMGMPAEELLRRLDALGTASGVIGVNFLVPFLDPAEVEVLCSRVRVVEFFYGDPDPALVATAHRGGALAAWQIGSVKEARQAVDAGCDFVVAQGTEAGGHVRGQLSLFTLLPSVLEVIEAPVVAAGGIGTARHVAAALAAGADGVRVGTRFLAAAESGAHPQYIDALIRAQLGDTVLTTTFSQDWPDAPHRVLRACVDAVATFDGDVVGKIPYGGEPSPVPRFGTQPPTRQTTGSIEAMAMYAGEAVWAVQRVDPAAEILHELADGAEELLRAWC